MCITASSLQGPVGQELSLSMSASSAEQSLWELLGASLMYTLNIKILKATMKEINLLTCLAVFTDLSLVICIQLENWLLLSQTLLPAWMEPGPLYFSAASSLAFTHCSHCSPWACQDWLEVAENDVTNWAGFLCPYNISADVLQTCLWFFSL